MRSNETVNRLPSKVNHYVARGDKEDNQLSTIEEQLSDGKSVTDILIPAII